MDDYSDIMRQLDIEIIDPKKTPICHYKPMNLEISEKEGFLVSETRPVSATISYTTLLRYSSGKVYLKIELSLNRDNDQFIQKQGVQAL